VVLVNVTTKGLNYICLKVKEFRMNDVRMTFNFSARGLDSEFLYPFIFIPIQL
jgi:hypothetical protein